MTEADLQARVDGVRQRDDELAAAALREQHLQQQLQVRASCVLTGGVEMGVVCVSGDGVCEVCVSGDGSDVVCVSRDGYGVRCVYEWRWV